MYAVRLFATRRSRFFQRLYRLFEAVIVALDPLFRRVGYERLEAPFAFLERNTKGFLFDCKMCGQCVLSSTGMSCPMNCPKNLRNGPCGGVRENGNCEVRPWMRCVWVEAWDGAARMPEGLDRIRVVQPPVNRELEGSSSWLRVAREKAAEQREARQSADPSKHMLARAFRKAREIEPASAPVAFEPDAALSVQWSRQRTSVYDAEAGQEKSVGDKPEKGPDGGKPKKGKEQV
jgi:hypothetical protein